MVSRRLTLYYIFIQEKETNILWLFGLNVKGLLENMKARIINIYMKMWDFEELEICNERKVDNSRSSCVY